VADLTQRLSLIVDAAGQGAEATFRRIASAAEDTSKAARNIGSDAQAGADKMAAAVAAAADRVATARMREADAYGKLRVEEQKLTDLREKGGATQAQIAAAEERIASAQRRVQSASAETTRATEAQTAAQKAAAEAAEAAANSQASSAEKAAASSQEAGDAADSYREKIKDLAGEAVALVGGFSLVSYLSDSVTGFMESARAAQSLASSMNATVEQGGQLAQMFGSLGLEASDLLEIQAEFAGTVAESATGLTALGTEVQHNRDGTVNWALTLRDTLGELQKIPDATERNRQGFAMFGEEGYKQLSGLVNSSTSVADAFDKIGFPVDEDDVRAVQEYDQAMLDLRLQSGQLGQTIGRAVVPVLTGLVEGAMDVANVIDALPGPTIAFAAAAVGLSFALRAAATEGSFLAGALAAAGGAFGGVVSRAVAATTSVSAFAAASGRASAAALGMVGGPIGAMLLAAGGAYYFASGGADEFAASTRDAARELSDAEGNLTKNRRTLEDTAKTLVEQAGYWEQTAAAARGYYDVVEESDTPGWIEETATALGAGGLAAAFADDELAARGMQAGIEDAAEALTGLEEQQETTQIATKTLTDLIAEGDTTSRAFSEAVREAAVAQEEEARTSGIAEAAIAAYVAQTTGAVEATLNLMNAQFGYADAHDAFLDAMDDARNATDDTTTSVNEVDQAYRELQQAALEAATESANAAVETARASGVAVDDVTEAKIRADAMLADLRARLNTPGLTDRAQADIQAMIDRLTTAQESGDIQAVLELTGVPEAEGELDQATQDRDTRIRVESRNGPAVIDYLNGIASADRLALIRVESRNGPAVQEYLRSLAVADRLALIRVESRNGPAVDSYLDSLTRERLAIIRVETRGGPAVDAYLDNLANQVRNASIGVSRGAPAGMMRGAPTLAAGVMGAPRVALGTVTLDLELTGRADKAALTRAERGRAMVADIRAYERENGTGWRGR
jgi:trimeric autotransporter adhesin